MMNQQQFEEHAFYESGLSADGCLQKLDSYTIEAIEKYGRILLEKQKENIVEGFQGCCYCCEPVGILNQQLEEQLEEKTKEVNDYLEFSIKEQIRSGTLSFAVEEQKKYIKILQETSKKLYGVVLHLQEVSKTNPVVVVGPSLYSEAVDAIKLYEEYKSNS